MAQPMTQPLACQEPLLLACSAFVTLFITSEPVQSCVQQWHKTGSSLKEYCKVCSDAKHSQRN
jgi:hypothetical protein